MKYFLVPALIIFSLSSLIALPLHASARANASASLTDYFDELDRWTAAAVILKEHPEKAAELRKALPGAWPVSIRGQQYAVSTDWLRATLDSLEVNHWLASDYCKEIQTRLAAMRTEAEALDRGSALGPGVVQNRMQEILRRREFREVGGPTWFEQLRERISNWLADLLVKIFGGLGSHPSLSNVLLWVTVVALVLLLMTWLFRYFLRDDGGTNLDLKIPALATRASKDWSRDALAAAACGDYREAIRCSYWAGIYRLEELDVWHVERSRTHREYLRLLTADATHRAPLAAITSRFEWIWYGGNPASADDFQSVVAQLDTLGCKLHFHPATANS